MKPAIALDLGGTRMKIGLVRDGTILACAALDVKSGQGLKPNLKSIADVINSLLEKAGIARSDLAGVGIAHPGLIDPVRMKVQSVNEKYPDSVDFDFTGWARSAFGLPLVLENDARAALVGEWKFGAGKDCDNLVMITLGTGLGTAAVIEGKLLRGTHYQAGILGGHLTVDLHAERCNCGNIGCAESEASSWSLPARARRHPGFQESRLSSAGVIDYERLFALAPEDDLARTLVQESLWVWSACVINLVHAYDPERVVLGGGIIRSADAIIPFIKTQVDERAWVAWGKVEIVRASDADNAALRGMAYLLNESV